MANWKPQSSQIIPPKSKAELLEEWRQQRLIVHQEWLSSSEGQAALLLEEKKKQAYLELNDKMKAWRKRCIDLQDSPPKVGTIFENVPIALGKEDLQFYSRLIFVCSGFPIEPEWKMTKGRFGLFCFLNRNDAEILDQLRGEHELYWVQKVQLVGYAKNNKSATLKVINWK